MHKKNKVNHFGEALALTKSPQNKSLLTKKEKRKTIHKIINN